MHYGFIMATITLKNIPDELHLILKDRAKRHGRSLNKEVIVCLEESIAPKPVDINSLLADIRKNRSLIPGKLTDKLIYEAKRAGRP